MRFYHFDTAFNAERMATITATNYTIFVYGSMKQSKSLLLNTMKLKWQYKKNKHIAAAEATLTNFYWPKRNLFSDRPKVNKNLC